MIFKSDSFVLILLLGSGYLTGRANGTTVSIFVEGEPPEVNETGGALEYFLSLEDNKPVAAVLKFGFDSNTSAVHRFGVDPSASMANLKLNLVLESMKCQVNPADPEEKVGIQIRSEDDFYWFLCENVTQPDTLFQTMNYVSAGKNYFEIQLLGNWAFSNADLVITVYKEVDSCNGCPGKTFCCEGGSSCEGKYKRKAAQESSRCISNILTCDNHANCGMVCNADESYDTCYWFYYYEFSFGYMSLLAITFFLLLPAMIILLGCYHRHMVMMRRVQATEERRRRIQADVVTSVSPPNDHPPTYNEVSGASEQPPCFCEAVKLPSGSTDQGITNNAFSNEESCSCGKGNSTKKY